MLMPLSASAQVLISELMYDLAEGSDAGREWIEVYNAGASPLTLTDWKLYENGTNHKVTAVQGGEILAPGMYAIIAGDVGKFKADHPMLSGQLFDSAFSLSNTGESFALRDSAGVDIDSVTYTSVLGANGTGDSLQRMQLVSGGGFSAGIPTPGIGIPASGLVKKPPKEDKKSTAVPKKKSSAKGTIPVAVEPAIVGEPAEQVSADTEGHVAG
ncbi:MAG: lamin tail domain-containing protein, partial [Patescibacteria group bacterium]